MTKKLLALLLSLGMLVSLCACGGTANAPASSGETAAPVSSAEEPAAETEEAAGTEEAEAPEAEVPEAEAPVEEDGDSAVEADIPETEPIVIEYPLFDEPTTFTLWTSNSPDLSEIISDLNEYTVFRELEKVTNVRWDATLVSFFSSEEQFSLMVAAEDYTDVVCRALDSYSGSVDQAIEEEFLIDLNPYIDENMPNLLGWFETYPTLRRALQSTEGAIAAFPKIFKEPSDVTEGGCLRLDWLEELNLDMPQTYDDLYNILTTFKSEKDAKAPLVIPVNTGVQTGLIEGYGIASGVYQVDGDIRFGCIQPEFKDYLAMMNKWYTEGLLSDSFLSSQAEVLMDTSTILSGDTGVWYGTGIQSITQLLSMATDAQPDMRITGVTYVTEDGSKAHLGSVGQVYDSNMWSVTTVCEQPEIICQYIDYIYGEDGILLANYGVEGETFEYDAEGNPKLTELVTNNPDFTYNLALNIYTCDRQTPVPFVIDEQKARNDYSEDQLNTIEVWNNATDGAYNLPKIGVNLTAEETEEYNAIFNDIDTYMDESISKFIVGDKSLDEFDAFVDQMITMGIEECVAIYQGAYDRYLNG